MRVLSFITCLVLVATTNAFVTTSKTRTPIGSGLTAASATTALSATLSVTGDSGAGGDNDTAPVSPSTMASASISVTEIKKKKTLKELRAEGGPFTINTPIGALNPFALYYGLLSLALGLPWFFALKSCQLLYFVTRGRVDPKRRIPVFFSQVWGILVLRLSRSYPEMVGLDKLQAFYSQNRPAMFVANHCSWMDIPFLGATVGWRNYKIVSKKELGLVPILGSAIRIGGNIMVDRTDRKSQLKTLKQGINYLKNEGIHLCTFPEGTRSRSGRLMKFKNGAFKMAHKAGAPIIPISIIGSQKVMPTGWMFSMRPSHGTAKIVIHEPIESEGKTEEELAEAVRQSMMQGLPEDQQPLK